MLDAVQQMNYSYISDAGWSSMVARRAHNPKVVGSNPAPATNIKTPLSKRCFFIAIVFIPNQISGHESKPAQAV